jgi:hypothetical protein
MGKWENGVFGRIEQKDWLDIGSLVPTRPNDPIDGLFGDVKTDNIMASWESLAAQYAIPMMAQFHGFDTEANTTFRVPIDTHNIEKGLIKVKINQSERLRQLTRTGVVGDTALYNWVLDDGARLADQIITRTKVAKNELMATGKVTIKENNLNLTVDYGVPADQTGFTLDLATTADIDAQIRAIIDLAQSRGLIINGMLTSSANITKMKKNAGLQTNINGNVGAGALIRSSSLNEYLNEEYGIQTVITNDLTYGKSATFDATGRPQIATERYYPTDKVTFFATAGGQLGTGLWGDSPEVDLAQFLDVNGSGVSPYVFIEQWAEKDPAVLWTKASALFIPVIYNPNSLFIADVVEGA